MRNTLSSWLRSADALRHLEHFGLPARDDRLFEIIARGDDLYIALVGELFDMMHSGNATPETWGRLGNAFIQFSAADRGDFANQIGVSPYEAALFSATAFYCGGFPASAYLALGGAQATVTEAEDAHDACYELLRRPPEVRSTIVAQLLEALRSGTVEEVTEVSIDVTARAERMILEGPDAWIPARLLQALINRFSKTNIRAVLPDGQSDFWRPLVDSFLARQPPLWEYFPSQIEAVRAGLLSSEESFTLQMPTGAGKTTLCETLLFWHCTRHPVDCAVLIVPYRSLASELRHSLVRHLNRLGISARCAYARTVPSVEEVRHLADTQVLVATPEALSGILSADDDFFRRISLVICDEGHLLDGGGRGVALELLLARMRARHAPAPPRFVFVSAIVPNVEEINAWLGGNEDSVVRSEYRPALAEFAKLSPEGSGASMDVSLHMHPEERPPISYRISQFLSRADFTYRNPVSKRSRVYPFRTVKTQAVAAARKAMSMGAAVVFAANKGGGQGAIGLAEELLAQLAVPLQLPDPRLFVDPGRVSPAVDYLEAEYGGDWVGFQMLAAGAVLHHGDIPQETREVLEYLLREGAVRFGICTSTLAEGVNLPVRTMVLYSVRRRSPNGRAEDMLTRDIKNLVGRAGRAGATTKGLVVCANPNEWDLVSQVARQAAGEPVHGALLDLLTKLRGALAVANVDVSNPILESDPDLHPLADGIDAALIHLVAEEIGEEELTTIALDVAEQTFAYRKVDQNARTLLERVFGLRAQRILEIRQAGRLGWISETGSRVRLLASVETTLVPLIGDWSDVVSPLDEAVMIPLIDWAWSHSDLQAAVRSAYRLNGDTPIESVRPRFDRLVRAWMEGESYGEIARRAGETVDGMLRIHSGVLSYAMQVHIEQGIALLQKFADAAGSVLGNGVADFPEHLRFGVPTEAACILASNGITHRRAAVALGGDEMVASAVVEGPDAVLRAARTILRADPARWKARMAELVYERTIEDLAPRVE